VARPRTYRWSEALTFTAGTSAALVMVNVAAAVLSFDWWTRLILISLLTLGAALLFQQQPLRSVQALATTWHTLVQNAKRAWRGIVFGIPIAVLASGLAVALWRAGELRGLVDQLRTPEALHTDGWLYIGVGIIALAFVEELLFRRLILDQWGTVVTWATAVAANAVLFGAWHLGAALQGDRDIWEVVAQAVIPGLCAVPLCWLRRRTDTIAGCVFVHAAASGTVLLLI
jgi:membrane protease YdiL (CAAX protease family)